MAAENTENTTEVNDDTAATNGHDDHGHEKPSYDDINTPAIVMTGLISALFTFLTIVFVQGLYYKWSNSYIRERSTDYVNKPVKVIIDGQKNQLEGTDEGTIPISDAMEKMLTKYGSDE